MQDLDGNCFYRPISYLAFGILESYDQIRQDIYKFYCESKNDVNVLRWNTDPEGYANTPDEVGLRVNENDRWATDNEFTAAATLFQRDVYLFCPEKKGDPLHVYKT